MAVKRGGGTWLLPAVQNLNSRIFKKNKNISIKYFQGYLFSIRLTCMIDDITTDENLTDEACTDEDLASRASCGDAAAFRAILERHYDRVFRVVYSVLSHQSESEDVTQEIWASLPKKLRQWRGDAKLTSWLHRIALNAAKDSIRRTASQTRIKAGYVEMETLSKGAIADTQIRLTWLQSALETLSDDLRATAALTLGEDMNFAQAAEVLGIAEGTVAWRMSEIRRRLKTLALKESDLGKGALA